MSDAAEKHVAEWAPTSIQRHYNESDGPAKVAARRMIYDCIEDGVPRVDFDTKIVDAAHIAELGDESTVLDIGCAYPRLLELFRLCGHTGRLIGIEPNTAQFNGLAYWQPLDADPVLETLKQEGDEQKLSDFYRLNPSKNLSLEGIELFEAQADFIPLNSGIVDLAIYNQSLSHVAKDKQRRAIEQTRRVQKKIGGRVAGITVIVTSGDNNKPKACAEQIEIGEKLTEITGIEFQSPAPINSGFTAKDAVELLPDAYKHVYMFEHKARTIFDTPMACAIYMNAHRTFRDLYRTITGRIPSMEEHEVALQAVVGTRMKKALETVGYYEDVMDLVMVMASDHDFEVDNGFEQIS